MANTTSADAIVNSVGGQFAGTASKLEMDMVVKSSISFSDIITVITTLILLILIILFVSGWIPFIKIVLKKMNIIITRSKE
jgi:hypothetical protein